MALLKDEQRMHWYVMRDLKRPNAKLPAYKQLSDEHLEVFTPMQWRLKLKNGKRIREEVPFMQDLLFVHDTQEVLDQFVHKIPTLQYRYQEGWWLLPTYDCFRFGHGALYTRCQKFGKS